MRAFPYFSSGSLNLMRASLYSYPRALNHRRAFPYSSTGSFVHMKATLLLQLALIIRELFSILR